jgi:hypothetical protein
LPRKHLEIGINASAWFSKQSLGSSRSVGHTTNTGNRQSVIAGALACQNIRKRPKTLESLDTIEPPLILTAWRIVKIKLGDRCSGTQSRKVTRSICDIREPRQNLVRQEQITTLEPQWIEAPSRQI